MTLRLPGVFWGHVDRSDGAILEPDEFQHITVAAHYLHRLDHELGRDVKEVFWNSRAYGVQLSFGLYIGAKLGFPLDTSLKKVLIGRMLSVLYSLLLLLVVYRIGLHLFGRAGPALWSMLCLAAFDLNTTMSHYALPEMMYNFCLHLSILGMLRWAHQLTSSHTKVLTYIILCIGGGWTLGAKLDFLPFFLTPLFIFGMQLILTHSLRQSWATPLIVLTGSILAFFLAHLFYYPWEEMIYSYKKLTELNQDVIGRDQHWLYNPLLYLVAVVAGTSLPIMLLVFSRLKNFWEKTIHAAPWMSARFIGISYFLLLIIMEFAVRWSLDTPFVRRADIFLPAVALAAGYALWQLWESGNNWKKGLAIGIVLYTLGLTVVNQSNFWQDTRYEAMAYLQQQVKARSFHYGTYAFVPGMPKEGNDPTAAPLHIMHESHYGRYWKFFTTPFRVPACCEEVYNCWSEADCERIQAIFRGETDYRLIVEFPSQTIFPERILFKRWFGTYETFLGDVRIYEEKK
ncbi:MAG: phospholipid carrier-dependent glycosyltransferase [Saprospiraceae bacterium]|nr:phospholipid carrier-dependent glycosyltransferase [Lewinella sp.]